MLVPFRREFGESFSPLFFFFFRLSLRLHHSLLLSSVALLSRSRSLLPHGMTALLLTTSAVALPSDVEALTKANGGQAPAVATRSTALSPSDFAASSSSDSSSSFFSLVRSLPASASLGHASAEAAGVLRVAAAALAPGGTLELAEEVRKEWESK